MPIAIQPRSGDTSNAAPTPHITNKSDTAIIKRLSLERLFKNSFNTSPKRTPTATIIRLYKSGMPIAETDIPPPTKAIAIDTMIFDLYNISKEERELIGFVEIE
jgi:hypothetical protein